MTWAMGGRMGRDWGSKEAIDYSGSPGAFGQKLAKENFEQGGFESDLKKPRGLGENGPCGKRRLREMKACGRRTGGEDGGGARKHRYRLGGQKRKEGKAAKRAVMTGKLGGGASKTRPRVALLRLPRAPKRA
jgi:hypothetical protein